MRRMATTKQLDYVNDLREVAEKGFQVGTYPNSFDSANGILDLEFSFASWLANDQIDFENHVVTAGAYYEFKFPDLLIHYGLSDGGNVGYVDLYSDEDFEFPETINDDQSLKQYLESSAGVQALAAFLDDSTLSADEIMIYNDVAMYDYDDFNVIGYTSDLVIYCSAILECSQGAGEEIVEASDPVGESTLNIENLQVNEKIVKHWTMLYGSFDTPDYNLIIIPCPSIVRNNRYYGQALGFASGEDTFVTEIWVDFNTGKIYDNGSEIGPYNSAQVLLIDALSGEELKSLVL